MSYNAVAVMGRSNAGSSSNTRTYYTNVPASNGEVICGKNCTCSKNKKYATEKSVPGYDYINYLGAGAFGAVHLYRNRETRVTVAIKEMSFKFQGKDIYHHVATEYEIVMNIKHPNITRYFDFFVLQNRSKCYIVMEYAKRGTLREMLHEQIKKWVLFDQKTVLRMISDVINGVMFLNQNYVVHCDLKPENILIGNDGSLKICDFGTAHFVYDYNAPLISTTCYRAPELFEGMRPDEKTEVWTIGVIFYELCTLAHPFEPFATNAELIPKIKAGLFKSLNCRVSGYSYDMQEILEYMLDIRRESRQMLANILKHKLLKQIKSEQR